MNTVMERISECLSPKLPSLGKGLSISVMGKPYVWCRLLTAFFFFALLLFQISHAQTHSKNKRAQQAYEKAGSQLSNRQFGPAISSLERAIDIDTGFAAAFQQLADIHRSQRNFQKASHYYAKVMQLDTTLTALTWFGLGESLLHQGKYRQALPPLQKYLVSTSISTAGKNLTQKYIADCQFSLVALEHPQSILPFNPGAAINSRYDEYFPRLTADHQRIIFTRKSDDRENFYQSQRDSNANWLPASLLQGEINSELYNEGAHCITPDGKYLFFTGCNRPDGLGSCDIYVSKFEEGQWSAPHNIGAPINSTGWEAQPALSADGNTLYYVSNRRGGHGGYDIWKSTLRDHGHWGEPVNLGETINTPYDESSPFIHADNSTLYFASNGWPGFGDKDIFKSNIGDDGIWETPVNLGYPINDHGEQSAFSVSMNGREAYYSTRRADAIGGLDIYSFILPEVLRPHRVAYLRGFVEDKDSETPISASVTVTDIATNQVLFQGQSADDDGSFIAPLPFGKTYALHIKQPDYLFFSENYRLDDSSKTHDAYELHISLSRIRAGTSSTLNNIFFEVNQYTLLPHSKSDLENLIEFLQLNKLVRIEIGGHTDNTGSESHNQVLSENRAKSVHDYLVHAGIAPSRLSYKGYGQSNPVANNSTNEGRQLNRRTDFRILTVD